MRAHGTDELQAPEGAALPLGPAAASRRVLREPMVVACGGRALLMQVAHPLVASAVSRHSSYEKDPWLRLARTLGVMERIVFGSPATSKRQARSLARLHSSIAGETAGGVPYVASEPALLVWVWATLVDTALLAFESSRGRLAAAERHQYYEEQKLVAQACGVPREACPPTVADFDDYLTGMLAGGLQVTPEARAIARAVLRPPLRAPLGLIANVPLRLLNVGLLPDSLREGYGLSWSASEQELLRLWLLGIRCTNAVVPDRVRDISLSLLAPAVAFAFRRPHKPGPAQNDPLVPPGA